MTSWFDLIQDKPSSPYYNLAEKLEFINNAQTDLVNELAFQYLLNSRRLGEPSARVYSSVESTEAALEVLEPLMVHDIAVSSSASGVINRSDIKSAMNIISGDTEGFMMVTSLAKSLGDEDELPVRFVRANDFYQFQRNEFKKATSSEPQFRISRDKLTIRPSGVANYLTSVLKYPIDVVVDLNVPSNNVDSELPDFTHNDIMAIALDNAGVSSRDIALIQAKQASDRNLSTLA